MEGMPDLGCDMEQAKRRVVGCVRERGLSGNAEGVGTARVRPQEEGEEARAWWVRFVCFLREVE